MSGEGSQPDSGRPADWDASTYARVSTPQREWARAVIGRLDLRGDEIVLDAGCGSGDVTAQLLEQLPEGRVIGVDGSPSMIAQAAERLPADRVDLQVQDLAELRLDERVDHAFSNATFHWIPDHDAMFSRLRQAIKPGGKLVAQCGGRGNVAEVTEAMAVVGAEQPFAEHIGDFGHPWNFAGPEDTEIKLIAAGFSEAECWLEERVGHPEEPRAFLEASFLAPFRERLPEDLYQPYVDRLMEALDQPESFNYVRLNIEASRA